MYRSNKNCQGLLEVTLNELLTRIVLSMSTSKTFCLRPIIKFIFSQGEFI